MSDEERGRAVTVRVIKDTAPGEQRVAVVPESVPALTRMGARVLVESGAGAAAWFPDSAYAKAGATAAGTSRPACSCSGRAWPGCRPWARPAAWGPW